MVPSASDKIFRRAGHVTFAFRNEIFIWGGYAEQLPKKPRLPNTSPANSNDFHETDELFAYDPQEESWRRIQSMGEIPPRTVGAAWCTLENELFIFGGYHGYESDVRYVEGNNNLVFRLNLVTLEWKCILPRGEPPIVTEKATLFAHNGYLYTFGGYGEPPEQYKRYPVQPRFDPDPSSPWAWPRGWSGNLVRLDPLEGAWEWLKTKGEIPNPVAGHTCAVVDNLCVLFGGRTRRNRTNEVFLLDLNSLLWKQVSYEGIGSQYLPEGRVLHSMSAAVGESQKREGARFFIYGGLGNMCTPLADAWIFQLGTCTIDGFPADPSWREVPLAYDHGEPRCWHGQALTASREVIIHSGLTQEYYLNRIQLDSHAEETLKFEFGPRTLLRAALERILKDIDRFNKDLNTLPKNLQKMIDIRLYGQHVATGDRPSPEDDPPFDREVLHAGI